jgi:hypothetical protein
MKKLLKRGHHSVIPQIFSLYILTSRPSIPMDLQKFINNHSKVFGEMPKGIPSARDHVHGIHLKSRYVPPNTSNLTSNHMYERVILNVCFKKC